MPDVSTSRSAATFLYTSRPLALKPCALPCLRVAGRRAHAGSRTCSSIVLSSVTAALCSWGQAFRARHSLRRRKRGCLHGVGEAGAPATPKGQGLWHGVRARLPSGSVVYLEGFEAGSELAGEPCTVRSFDGERQKWRVRMLHPRFHGAEAFVEEQRLSFGYCILPEHASLRDDHCMLRDAPSQGACGRGLQIAESVKKGQVLFEESPFLMALDDTNEMCRAHFMMSTCAKSEKSMQEALDVFEDLSTGSFSGKALQQMKRLAGSVVDAAVQGDGPSGKDFDFHEREAARMSVVLRRWEANRFCIDNGLGQRTYVLYRTVTRLNHSCNPTATSGSEFTSFRSGTLSPGDGRCIVRAARDLQPGDPLCHNYGPQELLTWPVAKRRTYLWKHNGFMCKCERCREEGRTSREA
mmetsp:Transcript_108749/g.318162  ORF Transcript_108749/g.318162 Transcript_108749/m.318162 type:complete len:410 (+) Transcript_108749:42-1271(+)